MDGRDTILAAIRRGLRRGPLPTDQADMLRGRLAAHPRHLVPARSRLPRAEQLALFLRNVEKEFGSFEKVPDADAVPGAVADYLAAQNLAPRFVLGPHPELLALPWASRPMLEFEARRAVDADRVSVQHAFAGVAETGTLVLPSGPHRPTTLNLLPDTAVVVLRATAVVGAYEEVWDRLRAGPADAMTGGFLPRNVMLVTGPSRSADIEQTLELGAHGPRRLHVVLIEDGVVDAAPVRGDPEAEAVVRPGEKAGFGA